MILQKGRAILILFLFCAIIAISTNDANANPKYASLVIDADTGVVLHQENAGSKRYPASLVKMMTLYMTFNALENGTLRMNKMLRVSRRAAGQQPSKIGLKSGQRIKTRDAIMALVVKSANDASVVLAEAIGGSEWQFAEKMNKMATRLGMDHTTFKNASGLHNRRQKTTAYDMARLAVALRRDHGRYYHLFDRKQFRYKGKTYYSHNRVAKTYRGADGLKTGYINASGFNLVTSVKRSGRSIVAVVLGGRTTKRRDNHMVKLLDRAFYKIAKQQTTGKRIYARSLKTPKPNLKPNLQKVAYNDNLPSPMLKPIIKTKIVQASTNRKTIRPRRSSSYSFAPEQTLDYQYRLLSRQAAN